MRTARAILSGMVILAGPIAIFCLIGSLPFGYVSWLGGGLIGIVAAMAVPGIVGIATLKIPSWKRATAALLYLLLYAPACLLPGFLVTCALSGCDV